MNTKTYYFADWEDIPCEIIDKVIGDSIVKVGAYREGYLLWWSDGVANDWTEFYPELSVTLARLAALIYCGEHDWEKGFTQSDDEFHARATEFFAAVTA